MAEFTYPVSMSGLDNEAAREKARWIAETFQARNKAEYDLHNGDMTPELAATARVVSIFSNVTDLDGYEAAIRLVLRGMASAARLLAQARVAYPAEFHAVMGEVYRDCLNNYILNFNWR